MTWTVLRHACEHLDSKCILERCKTSTSELLEVDDHGSTPLHILAWGNPNLDLLKALVDCCPAAVSDQNVHGDTCLHIACSYPGTDVKVVRLLVDACPGLVSTKNKEGLMPLHVACRCSPENKAVISCLVETYPNALLKPSKMGDLIPKRKKQTGHPYHFVSPDNRTNFAEGRFESLSTQVRDGAFPLHMAVKAGAPVSVLTTLIQAGREALIKTNKFGETPLHVALHATVQDDAAIEVLVDEEGQALRTKESTQGNLPIHVAVSHGWSTRVVKMIVQHYQPSLHEKNMDGKTPLDLALEVETCSEDILKLLNASSSRLGEEVSSV